MKPNSSPAGVSPWLVWPVVLAATGAGVMCAVLLAAYLLPRGHEAVWVWQLRKQAVPPLPWTLPAAVALLLIALLTLDSLRAGRTPSRRACMLFVACLTLACGSLMLGMALDDTDYPYRASAVILGDMSMGYYAQAARIHDVGEFIHNVEDRTEPGNVPERVATHPPGPALYFWAARRWLDEHPQVFASLRASLERWSGDEGLRATTLLCRRVATFGPDSQDVAAAFWSGLALTLTCPLIIPLTFGIGALAGDRRLGLVAAVFACAIPSLLCFNPSVDALAAVLAGAVVLSWLWTLRSGRSSVAVLCGVLWAIGLSWTFGLVALAALIAAVAVAWRADTGKESRATPLIVGLIAGLALASLAGFIVLGYDPVTSMVRSLAAQRSIMLNSQRPYDLSIVWNLYDFALLAGPTMVLAAIAGTVLGLGRRWKPRIPAALGIALALTLIGLVLTGGTRGEVGRIWGFLMPCLALPAALPISQLRGWSLMGAGLLILAGQVALAIVANSYLALVTP